MSPLELRRQVMESLKRSSEVDLWRLRGKLEVTEDLEMREVAGSEVRGFSSCSEDKCRGRGHHS